MQAGDRDQGSPFGGLAPPRFVLAALAAAALAFLLALPAAASASQTLSVEKAGAGAGTLTSSPAGIECGATCNFAFADSTVVTLTATPGPNSAPATWSGCDSVNGEDKCIVTMSAAKEVTATFALLQRQLTLTKSGSGTGTVSSSPGGINCGATCTASYEHGTSVTLSGTSGPNTQAPQWSGCGTVTPEDKCIVTMNAAKGVTATFALVQRQLTISKAGSAAAISSVTSSPAGISCGPTCSADFDIGATVTLTGAPGAHTHAVQWTGCDSVSAGKCTVTMSEAKAVTATFDLIQFSLSVTKAGLGAETSTVTSSPAAIACGASCSANLTEGTALTLTGTPGPHTKAVVWGPGSCDSIASGNKCLVAMSKAKAITATFDPQPGAQLYAITVQRSGDGEGTVTGSPGQIDCGGVCSAELVEGATVSLSASPAPGSVFARWSGGGCSGAGPCTTTLTKAKTVTAVFELTGTRTLSIQKAGAGQGTVTSRPLGSGIDCGQTCSSPIAAGTNVTLTAKAAEGSNFARWGGACQGTANTCKVTMSEARSATATFTGGSSAASPPPSCVVPRLTGKSPSKARAALAAAHCALGKVSKPKARRGHRLGALVVKSFSPGAGTALPAGGRVDLKLKPAPKKRGKRHQRG